MFNSIDIELIAAYSAAAIFLVVSTVIALLETRGIDEKYKKGKSFWYNGKK